MSLHLSRARVAGKVRLPRVNRVVTHQNLVGFNVVFQRYHKDGFVIPEKGVMSSHKAWTKLLYGLPLLQIEFAESDDGQVTRLIGYS